MSKIDYIFMSRALHAQVSASAAKWYELGANLDHANLSVDIGPGTFTARGRSFPKLFSTDIGSDTDKMWLLDQLKQCEIQMLPHWDPHCRLEFLKMNLRTKALELRHMRKVSDNATGIKQEIDSLIAKVPLSQDNANRIDMLKLQLFRNIFLLVISLK